MADEIKNTENEELMQGNFIHSFIDEDIAEGGRFEGKKVHTRFPPEPNGYLHIGHAKAICINFATAEKYNGMCNLRMDDTNPTKEDVEYVDAIKEDIKWLGFDWEDRQIIAVWRIKGVDTLELPFTKYQGKEMQVKIAFPEEEIRQNLV